jgi:hypothetical protein
MVENLNVSDSPADRDWLRCLHCDYNLTGLTECRCPECGQPFDPEYLRALASDSIQPVHPWDDRAQIGLWRAFWRTCWATWFKPADFARHLPLRVSDRSAWEFSGVCYTIVVLGILTVGGGLAWPDGLFVAAFYAAFVPISAFACEVALASMIASLARPTRGHGEGRYAFWRGLTHFTSSYCVLSTASVTLSVLLLAAAFADDTTSLWLSNAIAMLGLALGTASVALWWRALAVAVLVRGQASPTRRVLAILLVPVAAVVAVGTGGMVVTLLGMACSPL